MGSEGQSWLVPFQDGVVLLSIFRAQRCLHEQYSTDEEGKTDQACQQHSRCLIDSVDHVGQDSNCTRDEERPTFDSGGSEPDSEEFVTDSTLSGLRCATPCQQPGDNDPRQVEQH